MTPVVKVVGSSKWVVGGVVTPDTVLKGDNVYIKHTEIEYITQNVVSRTENVNPFMVSEYFGSITLSPQSDEWKVDQHAAAKIIDGGTRLNTNQAVMFDQSEWGWLGNDIEGLEVGDATRVAGTTTSSSRSFTQRAGNLTVWGFDQTTSSIVNRVVASETIRTSLGSKIIERESGIKSKEDSQFSGLKLMINDDPFGNWEPEVEQEKDIEVIEGNHTHKP